jgi:hypothetical protein
MSSQNPWQVAGSSGLAQPQSMEESAEGGAYVLHHARMGPGGGTLLGRETAYRGSPPDAGYGAAMGAPSFAGNLPPGLVERETTVNAARITAATNAFIEAGALTRVDSTIADLISALTSFSSALDSAAAASATSGGPSYGLTPN